MDVYEECRRSILDWIEDQIRAHAGCPDEIAVYREFIVQISALAPFSDSRSIRSGNPL